MRKHIFKNGQIMKLVETTKYMFVGSVCFRNNKNKIKNRLNL